MKNLEDKTLRRFIGYIFSTFILLLVLLTAISAPSVAQQNSAPTPTPVGLEDGWTVPRNLSRSGATSAPQMVRDSNGIWHVIWRDAVLGFVYTHNAEREWSKPLPVEVPFGTVRFSPGLTTAPQFTPHLIADTNGRLHAFWIDEEEDILYHSVALAKEFADFNAWTPRQQLSKGVRALTAAFDDNGVLHLAYLRYRETADFPAGIYYRQLAAETEAWTEPLLQYASAYLRTLARETVNLRLTIASNNHVFLAWDDNLLEHLFLARSSDGGVTWDEPKKMDSRAATDVPTASGPAKLTVGAYNNDLFATWQAGHEEAGGCTQYLRRSPDKGRSWQPTTIFEPFPTCLNKVQFLISGNSLYLLGRNNGATYLFVWDGEVWSRPQQQETLATFTNAETNQPVLLGCHQTAIANNRLFVLGCDEGTAGDVWWLDRRLNGTTAWFPTPSPTPVWQTAAPIASQETAVTSLDLISDDSSSVHAMWIQANDRRIWYAGWDGNRWSAAAPVLSSPSPNPTAIKLAVGNGRLFAVWEAVGNGIYFSQVNSQNANIPTEWSEPTLLPAPRPIAASPDIALDRDANIFVAYTIPLNEARGIYLVRSNNLGESWSEPIQVFDGSTVQWELVADPKLATIADNHLHLLWSRRDATDTASLAVAYSQSTDFGDSWIPYELVVNEQADWSDVLGTQTQTLHRVWLIEGDGLPVLQHSHSVNNGQVWSPVTQIGNLDHQAEKAILTADSNNRPHLFARDLDTLRHWVWQDGRWIAEEGVVLAPDALYGATISENGRLVAVYDTAVADELGKLQPKLFFTERELELPPVVQEFVPTATTIAEARTVVVEPTAVVASTATPEATPTIIFSADAPDSAAPLPGFPEANNTTTQLAFGIIPAGFILIIALFIGIRAVRIKRG